MKKLEGIFFLFILESFSFPYIALMVVVVCVCVLFNTSATHYKISVFDTWLLCVHGRFGQILLVVRVLRPSQNKNMNLISRGVN